MHKVKQLYETFNDDSGHTYLVKKEDSRAFFKQLDKIEDAYAEQFDDLLSYFNVERLEGERHYVVLLDDLIEE